MRRSLLTLLLAVPLLAACGEGGTAPTGPTDVEAMRRFEGFPLYWLGPRYGDLALTYAEEPAKQLKQIDSTGVRVEYGTCELPEGEGGCTAPLAVVVECGAGNVERYDVESRRMRVRGVPARMLGGGELEVYTGDVIVAVVGQPRLLRRAAEALRPLNGDGDASGPLPKPRFDITPRRVDAKQRASCD